MRLLGILLRTLAELLLLGTLIASGIAVYYVIQAQKAISQVPPEAPAATTAIQKSSLNNGTQRSTTASSPHYDNENDSVEVDVLH